MALQPDLAPWPVCSAALYTHALRDQTSSSFSLHTSFGGRSASFVANTQQPTFKVPFLYVTMLPCLDVLTERAHRRKTGTEAARRREESGSVRTGSECVLSLTLQTADRSLQCCSARV